MSAVAEKKTVAWRVPSSPLSAGQPANSIGVTLFGSDTLASKADIHPFAKSHVEDNQGVLIVGLINQRAQTCSREGTWLRVLFDAVESCPNGIEALTTTENRNGAAAGSRLFTEVVDLMRRGSRVSALDHVYEVLDDLLHHGQFERVVWILKVAEQQVDVKDVPTSVFISLLTMTRPWKMYFSEPRSALLLRLFERLAREEGTAVAHDLVGRHL